MAIDHNPKVFISYSWTTHRWTTREYKKKVRELAARLRSNGVNVILDQWDLRPGHDMNAFMERNIREADKVLILCERGYAEKADARTGGVGKETYIISEEVYKKYKQEKFIPVVMEKPSALPAYLKSRYAVFFANDDEDEYKDLLRTIFDIPDKAPEIGPLPSEDWVRGVAPAASEEQKNNTETKRNKNSGKAELGTIPTWVLNESEAVLRTDDAGNAHVGSTIDENKLFIAKTEAIATVSSVNVAAMRVNTRLHKGDRKYSFGKYPQNMSGKKEPLLWRVLDVDENNNRALIITEKLIDCRQYHSVRRDVTWEDSDLRKWMNHDFINEAFTDDERVRIAEVIVQNKGNDIYGTKGGNSTLDRAFALSIDEAETYFKNNADRIAPVTPYAEWQGSWTRPDKLIPENELTGWWWLRSPGNSNLNASDVDYFGKVSRLGCGVLYGNISVRPALWLNL